MELGDMLELLKDYIKRYYLYNLSWKRCNILTNDKYGHIKESIFAIKSLS